ncbi:hypothetical protein TNCV_3276191 [Trichonephila clavipes]|nr:hypothetical protein TNCV_3276191 [Trichonephila clavipes]
MIMHDLTELGLLRVSGGSRFGTNGMASSISRPETSLNYLGREVAALNPPQVPLRHGGTLNSRRAASPLMRLVEGEERWEAPDSPGCSPSKLGWNQAK